MALDSFPILGPDGLTATERVRKVIRDILRERFPDVDDEQIWQAVLDVEQAAPFGVPPVATTLTYAWTDGQTFSSVDRATGIPDDARERAVLRGLLAHALKILDEREHPLRIVDMPIRAIDC